MRHLQGRAEENYLSFIICSFLNFHTFFSFEFTITLKEAYILARQLMQLCFSFFESHERLEIKMADKKKKKRQSCAQQPSPHLLDSYTDEERKWLCWRNLAAPIAKLNTKWLPYGLIIVRKINLWSAGSFCSLQQSQRLLRYANVYPYYAY